MTDIVKHSFLRSRRFGIVVGTIVVLAAGAAGLEENRARFLQTSPVARRDLTESLKRFDHDLSDQQQQTLRTLDDRLNALPEADRAPYLAVMRRFHNWLDTLPERVRDDLLAKDPDQRMTAIKTLVAKYPLPSVEVRSSVDFIQTGGTGVFEVASLCKTWLSLPPEERRKLDAAPAGGRRAELHRLGRANGIPFELAPADFNEKHWNERVEERINEVRSAGGVHKDWIAKLEARNSEVVAKRKANGKIARRPFIHRLAVNLYVQEHAAPPAVDAGRLVAFLGALPSWVQSTFNFFPSDEARRRLTLVYRLVFPSPQEFDPRAGTKKPPSAGPHAATPPASQSLGPPRPAGPSAPPRDAPSKSKSSKPSAPF